MVARNTIPKIVLLLISFSSALCCASEPTPKKVVVRPEIAFQETTFDFGEAYQNKELTHTFNFRNTGDSPLQIERVSAP